MLAGVRPEEVADWPVTPSATLSLRRPPGRAGAGHRAGGQDRPARRRARRGRGRADRRLRVPAGQRRAARPRRGPQPRDGGSLTVIATSPVARWRDDVIALDRAAAALGTFPALALGDSGVLRAELLVGEAGVEALRSAAAGGRYVRPSGARGQGGPAQGEAEGQGEAQAQANPEPTSRTEGQAHGGHRPSPIRRCPETPTAKPNHAPRSAPKKPAATTTSGEEARAHRQTGHGATARSRPRVARRSRPPATHPSGVRAALQGRGPLTRGLYRRGRACGAAAAPRELRSVHDRAPRDACVVVEDHVRARLPLTRSCRRAERKTSGRGPPATGRPGPQGPASGSEFDVLAEA